MFDTKFMICYRSEPGLLCANVEIKSVAVTQQTQNNRRARKISQQSHLIRTALRSVQYKLGLLLSQLLLLLLLLLLLS